MASSAAPGRHLNSQAALLVFGEVLFDAFTDGTRVLGGAPFNVAWALQGLGQKPAFVSAIGRDPAGEAIQERMGSWGLRRDGLQELGD